MLNLMIHVYIPVDDFCAVMTTFQESSLLFYEQCVQLLLGNNVELVRVPNQNDLCNAEK